jgi:chromosome segregation ATPase
VSVGAVPVAPAPAFSLHEFGKLIEELKSLKNRSQSLDLAKLEDQHTQARDAALKAVEKKAGRGSSEDIVRLQAEAKKIVEAEHERSKEILIAKFTKIDQGLAALTRFLQELGPVKEMEVRVHEQATGLRKMEEELRVQRKVLAHEQEELERDKGGFESQQSALNLKQKELEKKLANLEVAKRAEEINMREKDFEDKVKAFEHEMAEVEHQRNELNKDFDKLGEKRAELDADIETLAKERQSLGKQKAAMAEVVAKEMALTFEAFVRDMLRPPSDGASEPESAPAPAKPAPQAAPEPEPQPDGDASSEAPSPKKSDFWQ